MQKSESIAKLAKALSNVQANIKPAVKDAANPFFKSKYADLNSVWDSCRELLTKNGLSVIQGNSVGLDGTVIVETVLAHESGEWIQSELALPLAKNDPQGVGSAVTYGRRYGLAAIVGIVADVDDDGNHASGHSNGKAKVTPTTKLHEELRRVDNAKPTEVERLKKVVWNAAQELGWELSDLNTYTQDLFGGDYPVANLNEKQLSTVSVELSKKIGEVAA
jgi:hypothetical protein